MAIDRKYKINRMGSATKRTASCRVVKQDENGGSPPTLPPAQPLLSPHPPRPSTSSLRPPPSPRPPTSDIHPPPPSSLQTQPPPQLTSHISRDGRNCTCFYVNISQFLVYERSFVLVKNVRELSHFLLHFCAGTTCALVLV
jgi:hypothetical protein